MGILRDVIRDVIKPVLVDVSDRWWSNPWNSPSPIKLVVEYTDTQFAFKFKAPSTSILNIYDGDGTFTAKAGNNATLVTHTTSYAAPGTYYFYVEGDWVDITYLSLQNHPFISGDISRWSEMVDLTLLAINNTNVYGDISGFGNLSSLFYIKLDDTNVTGDISSWTSLTPTLSLQIRLRNCNVTGDISGWSTLLGAKAIDLYNTNVTGDISSWSTLTALVTTCNLSYTDIQFSAGDAWTTPLNSSFMFVNCGLSASEIDNLIIAVSGITGARLNVYDDTIMRTSASDAAFETALSNGAYIVVNESSAYGTLGAELNDEDANAVSIGNEADAVIGWTPSGLTGDNEFISQALIKTTGSFAFKLNANPTPTANCGITKSFTVDAAAVYRLSQDIRHNGTGDMWWLYLDGVFTTLQMHKIETEFLSVRVYFKSLDTSLAVQYRENEPNNDGGIYLDNVSLKKVTLPA